MVGVQGVEGGLTISLLPAGLVWHPGSLPHSGSPTKPLPFHLIPSQPFMSQQVMLLES